MYKRQAYGIVVAIFQWGWFGSVFGIAGAPIEPFLPMMMFAIVFGLSMDYEVFLLSRVKEEYDRTGDAKNSVADGLYGVDREGNSTFVNRAMAEMTGWRAEEVVGRNQHELLHHTRADGSIFPAHECPVYRSCQDGKARHIPEDLFWRKDGSHFPVEYACSPLRDDNGGIVGGVVVFRDISERQRSEEASRRHQLELAHRDRLNTLGEMAAGIAHEINQPLTAIASNAQACIRLLDAGLDADRAGRLSDALAHIALQAQRGGDIIRQVRQFVKKDAPVKTAVDINELVQKVVALIRPEAQRVGVQTVSYTHLRAHETVLDLVCRLLLEKKTHTQTI